MLEVIPVMNGIILSFSDEKVRREAIGILRKPESGPTAAASKGIGGGTFDQACRYFSDKVSRWSFPSSIAIMSSPVLGYTVIRATR